VKARTRTDRWLVPAAIALLAGCIVIPVDFHAAGSRHNVNAEVQPKLQVGVTTKEDVFLLLGEPDFVSEDGQRLGYKWSKVNALVVYGAYYTGGVAEIQRSHLLFVSFDADNRVAQVGVLSAWGSGTPSESGVPPRK
jgi:outer membrane protein assembly factor BamE (lipoprotein component of BamABCDE complex)